MIETNDLRQRIRTDYDGENKWIMDYMMRCEGKKKMHTRASVSTNMTFFVPFETETN